jgi:hypothetical protein
MKTFMNALVGLFTLLYKKGLFTSYYTWLTQEGKLAEILDK